MRREALTIFEGPDGAGKTTMAKKYAIDTGAAYFHFDAMRGQSRAVLRTYVECMQTAIMGLRPVVMDRSWLSEVPYGRVFWNNVRFGMPNERQISRLAMTCGGVVVKCMPPFETCLEHFSSGRDELMDNKSQLRSVYEFYKNQGEILPTVHYDYTEEPNIGPLIEKINAARMTLHGRGEFSAGNLDSDLLVHLGELNQTTYYKTDFDPYFTWPTAGFKPHTPYYELSQHLESAKFDERKCCWMQGPLRFLPSGQYDVISVECSITEGLQDYCAKGGKQLTVIPRDVSANPRTIANTVYNHFAKRKTDEPSQ